MLDESEKPRHFIQQIIDEDLAQGKHSGKVVTRFPPEPNGFLHIGHAKSICLNFGLADEFNAPCHLRFDDTNPIKEEQMYVDAIEEDVRWLGFDWGKHLYHTSDYFAQLYDYAVQLIKQGVAYVDELTLEEIREYRGTLQNPGKNSPYRDRPQEESVDMFARMRAGEFPDGKMVLRAKIDMSSGNLNMRDPVIYRIRHATHQRTGDEWCIYPMYDFAHCLSDAIENITHSICTIEFQDHRPLYDWFIEQVKAPSEPQQIEFARLNVSHTITSKRKLRQLVEEKIVADWDDPRMPTLRGLRRRGYPPSAIRKFCEMTGVSKSNSVIDMGVLEESVRKELNVCAERVMAVLRPLKIVITNYPEDKTETMIVANHPQNPEMGSHEISFSRELYIDRDDFLMDPPKKFFRLAPGKEVRLRHAYVIKCEQVITDPTTGEVLELHCSYDADTLGKNPEGRKVKGVIHWLDKNNCQSAEVRLYDRLFTEENPAALDDFLTAINPESLMVLTDCLIPTRLQDMRVEQTFQFERVGYFCADKDSNLSLLIFNRIVSLRDSWSAKK